MPDDRSQPATLVVAAELRGGGKSQQDLFDTRDDLRRRVAEDVEPVDLGGRDPERLRYAVFLPGDDDPFVRHFRDAEPVFGEPGHRFLNLAKLRELLPAPRVLPRAEPAHKDELSPGDFWGAVAFAIVAAAVSAGLVAWLLSPGLWATLLYAAIAFCLLVLLPFLYTLSVLPATTWRAGRVKTQPLVIAHVVQAIEALWVPSHPDHPDGARFGLVMVFTLDPRRRDDTAWLGWLARRLAWLRDHGADDPDETRLAQRLEGEADDGTSLLPASVTGNDATYRASPMITRSQLPSDRLPADRLVPVLLPADAKAGDAEVKIDRVWPPQLWPLRHRPPWENRPDEPAEAPAAEDEPADRDA